MEMEWERDGEEEREIEKRRGETERQKQIDEERHREGWLCRLTERT